MERSGLAAEVATPHIEDLRALVARRGPFVTAIATCPAEGSKAIGSEANSVRRAVASSLAPELADEVAHLVTDAFPGAAGVVVVAEQDQILLVEHLDEAPRHPGVHHGTTPVLGAVLERRASDVPVVMASIDRTGADISWTAPLPAGATASGTGEVDGGDLHIRKVQGGGWSHRRFQQRAEDAWERTAREVAQAVAAAAEGIDARLVLLGGDDRMVHLVRDELPPPLAPRARTLPGSRAEDGSDDDRDDAARRWLRTAVAEDTKHALETFGEEQGQGDRAAVGLDAVLGALRESRVDLLLVHEQDDDDRTACFVPDEPTLVAGSPAELEGLGAEDVRVGRAADVAIRSALLTGGGVRIVPSTPHMTDGIAAVLRW